MSALHTLDARLYEVLAGSGLSAFERERVVDLCESVVAMTADLPHPGRTARCATHLLVGTDVTGLDPRVRGDIARLCEVAVVRGL
ncbi:hypothetical protein ASE01_07690 [Nocardioides sp. Root190]|uniref:hypothetical protein n=1 Tax=Nocardioides sp. Root190 TaxID=1736488 RepID=UPI0006FCE213|nr:hypothetical protein [Nocardioides sp. Root190]KRB78042.1 hypothetical protein ASE01_07690 [Nocardioides sp. Root190]